MDIYLFTKLKIHCSKTIENGFDPDARPNDRAFSYDHLVTNRIYLKDIIG